MPLRKKVSFSMSVAVSVILPAYNERDNVLPLIDEIHTALSAYAHEIIVIDDQSSDGTVAALKSRRDTSVTLIETSRRMGLGRSIRAGIEQARGECLVVMDSDFNHQPRYLPFMVGAMEVYDGAFASRFYPGGGMSSVWRQFLSRSFNVFVQLMLNSPVKDHLYGFFIIRRSVLERLPMDDIFWGYGDYCMRLIYYVRGETDRMLQFPAVNGERRFGRGNPYLWRTFIQYARAVFAFAGKVRGYSSLSNR